MKKTLAEQLSSEELEIFSEAQRCSARGDLSGTLDALKKLVAAKPGIGIARAMLANALWDMGDIKSAESEFLEAVKLSPDSEKVSLGLLHVLLKQDKTDEAFAEMKRFMKNNNSLEYEKLILCF